MIYTMTILDNVLDIANNFNISSNDRYIAYKLFEYCDEIEKMTLTEFLDKINVSTSQFKKFYQNLNCNNYNALKKNITLWCQIRLEQLTTRCNWQNIIKTSNILINLTNYKSVEEFLDIKIIDDICYQIKKCNRVILYGSESMVSLTHDFQIDMRLLGKLVVRSSLNEDKAIFPNTDDFICFFSLTGRIVNVLGESTRINITNSINKKLLITQNNSIITADYILRLNMKNEYYETYYIVLFYLDVIKTRYYYLYYKKECDK